MVKCVPSLLWVGFLIISPLVAVASTTTSFPCYCLHTPQTMSFSSFLVFFLCYLLDSSVSLSFFTFYLNILFCLLVFFLLLISCSLMFVSTDAFYNAK